MYQINAEEGLREQMARLGSTRPYMHGGGSYNTGAMVSTLDAIAHVSLRVLSGWAPGSVIHDGVLVGAIQDGTAGGFVLVRGLHATDVALLEEPVSPAEIVETVRNTFALNISETALVFHVSRPTIYQWTRLDEIGQVRSRIDRDRMKALFRISKTWAERGPLHGCWQQEVLPDGQSVLDLLSAKSVDEKTLLLAHDTLLARQGNRRQAEHNRAKASVEALKGAFTGLAAMQEARRKKKGSV